MKRRTVNTVKQHIPIIIIITTPKKNTNTSTQREEKRRRTKRDTNSMTWNIHTNEKMHKVLRKKNNLHKHYT